MKTQTQPLDQLILKLSPHDREEVRDFVLFLLGKHGKKQSKDKPQFAWKGALKHLADQNLKRF